MTLDLMITRNRSNEANLTNDSSRCYSFLVQYVVSIFCSIERLRGDLQQPV